MAVIARVTGAVVLWLVAVLIADLQMPAGENEREDVTVEDAAAASDDEPSLLPYVIATAGVLALGGLTLAATAAVTRWRHPEPARDRPSPPASRPPVAAGVGDHVAGRDVAASRGPGPPRS